MARTLIVSRENGIVTVDVRFDDIPQGLVTMLDADYGRWIAWATWKYDGVEVIEQSEYVTSNGWHYVMQQGPRGWSTYFPGDDFNAATWYDTREGAERDADAWVGAS